MRKELLIFCGAGIYQFAVLRGARDGGHLKNKIRRIGVTLTEDHTQEQTGSNAGNLFARIPGSLAGAPVLFAAHMDTVEPAKGKKPSPMRMEP